MTSPSMVASAQRLTRPSGIAVGGDRSATDRRAWGPRTGHAEAAREVLEVEQAGVVLAPLADHHAAAALGRIGIQPCQLAVDLALQVAGVKVLIQTAPPLRCAHRLAGAM